MWVNRKKTQNAWNSKEKKNRINERFQESKNKNNLNEN